MSNANEASVLIDTSFLISLYDTTRTNHKAALKYHKYFIENGITMYLPTIVVSEFHQKQPITDIYASGDYITLPFNYEDAVATADIAYQLGGLERRDENTAKRKDDLKLIGQARNKKITYIITDDERTLARYCKRLSEAKLLECKIIVLGDGFDSSILNGGQKSLLEDSE